MKPVEQTILVPPHGNCYPACLASIFEVGIEDIPPPPADTTRWMEYEETIRRDFLRPRGLTSALFSAEEGWVPEGYAILSAQSPRGEWEHAVVVKDGEIVWDPHPQRAMGVGKWKIWIVFLALDPVEISKQPAHTLANASHTTSLSTDLIGLVDAEIERIFR